jgi:hypothetical protein
VEQQLGALAGSAWLPRQSLLGMARNMLPSMVLGGAIPLAIYLVLRRWFAAPSLIPLSVALLAPMRPALVNLSRRQSADPFVTVSGTMMLAGLVITVGTILISGSEQVILISRSAPTLAMGLACLASFLLPRTLSFYFARQITAGNERDRAEAFNDLWQLPYVRFVARLTTLVWGMALIAEFVIRVILVYSLPIPEVIALSTIVFMTISMGTMLWTILYGRGAFRRIRQQATFLRAAQEAAR